MPTRPLFSTGLPGLDRLLHGVLAGDNIVLQVDAIEDYAPFVLPFARCVLRQERPLIYFHFADHPPLLPPDIAAETHSLHPEDGFETFLSEIFDVIESHGRGACYVFDSLSDLTVDWYSDRMLANFFMLTCPYLYAFDTVTYFALLRSHHTALAVNAIHNTAQVVVDVYRHGGHLFLQPRKVFERFSPTMYMLHAWQGDSFRPVTQSATISEIMAPQPWLDFAVARQDYWARTFSQAESLLGRGDCECSASPAPNTLLQRLLRMAISRDSRVLALAARFLDLKDLADIGKRLVGTGLIGGKSVGMVLARGILRHSHPRWTGLLEPHDSFFIGADVFYSYLVINKCWWLRRQLQKSGDSRFEQAGELRERLLSGSFPEEILAQFKVMLEYFGQSPIIVRSSSLLEDAYGNAFSGKYESVFCANQGTPVQRLEEFVLAVRRVYASTMQEEALTYRAHFGLLDRDEQMALLVQRVSGDYHGSLYFPQLAGVGFSFNPFVWNREIDPKAGMLRLVFGLGTRAVDRCDDDYTRIVALNAPLRRPDSTYGDLRKYSQKQVDVLDLTENTLATLRFEDVARRAPSLPLDVFATADEELERLAKQRGSSEVFPYLLTFDRLLREFSLVTDLRDLLQTLHQAYEYPVDVEFAVNFQDADAYRIHLLQCRPFQVKGELRSVQLPNEVSSDHTVLRTSGPVIGNSVVTRIDRLVYVVPHVYSQLPSRDRYSVARLVGKIVHAVTTETRGQPRLLLLGPGRWATTTPSLGVPVSFAEIRTANVVCEIAAMHDGLVPDVSLGTHFFNDLVEMDMLYLAVYPERTDCTLNSELLDNFPNSLLSLVPDAGKWQHAVRVITVGQCGEQEVAPMTLNADALSQRAVLYLGQPEEDANLP
ncbi:PEP/pyruvate-binding domain-containing protein [Myxococcota bacterium]